MKVIRISRAGTFPRVPGTVKIRIKALSIDITCKLIQYGCNELLVNTLSERFLNWLPVITVSQVIDKN